jgi:hypothetical protein
MHASGVTRRQAGRLAAILDTARAKSGSKNMAGTEKGRLTELRNW